MLTDPLRTIENAIVELEATTKMVENIDMATGQLKEIIRKLRESYDALEEHLTVK